MRAPQHDFHVTGFGGGWAGCECSRCGAFGIGGCWWPRLARYLPFCGRWRCAPEELTPDTHPALFEALAAWDHSNAEPFVLPDLRRSPIDLSLYPYQEELLRRMSGPDEVRIARRRDRRG